MGMSQSQQELQGEPEFFYGRSPLHKHYRGYHGELTNPFDTVGYTTAVHTDGTARELYMEGRD